MAERGSSRGGGTMDWTMILQIVITIITLILEYLGGGKVSKTLYEDPSPKYYLSANQWKCDAPYWSEVGKVSGTVFSGIVARDCEVQGTNGEGIMNLRSYMEEQVVNAATEVHGEPTVKSFGGLPGLQFDTTVTVEAKQEKGTIRGTTTLATNGFTQLKNVFHSSAVSKEGSFGYLKGMDEEVSVSLSERVGWYKVTIRTNTQISKPWWVTTSAFEGAVTQQLEKKMESRSEKVMNDIASHL